MSQEIKIKLTDRLDRTYELLGYVGTIIVLLHSKFEPLPTLYP